MFGTESISGTPGGILSFPRTFELSSYTAVHDVPVPYYYVLKGRSTHSTEYVTRTTEKRANQLPRVSIYIYEEHGNPRGTVQEGVGSTVMSRKMYHLRKWY